jgi:hypothetical protein
VKKLIDRYPGLIERHYNLKPSLEYLLPDPAGLENGMTVVLAAVANRYELQGKTESDFGRDFRTVLITNRWCTVKNVQTNKHGAITFIGIYPDGQEVQRICTRDTGWLVKKDKSIDVTDMFTIIQNKRREQVEKLLREGLKKWDIDENSISEENLEGFIIEGTNQIMKLIS